MVAAARDSELVEIVDHMLAKVRESVLSSPFRASTNPDMWAAAEAAAASARSNTEAALAMLRMRGAAYLPLADAARDVLITLAWMALAVSQNEEQSGSGFLCARVDNVRLTQIADILLEPGGVLMKTVLAFLMAVPMFAATCESPASLALPDSTITMAQVVAPGQFTPPGLG